MMTAQLPSPHSGQQITLSKRAKAAIVVRLLLNEGADIPLEELPEELQFVLTQQMGQMRMVDVATLNSVVTEFTEMLEQIGLSFPGGMAGALNAMDGKISPQTAERLRKEAGVRQSGDPWKRIRGLNAQSLLPVLKNESIEVAAVMLAKLDVGKAAELLGMLPGPQARRITYAMSLTGEIAPDAVDRIGLALASQLDARPAQAFTSGPVERLGAILNYSASATREDVLTGLDETDADFAEQVRRAIFTFASIPERIAARDIPRIVREIDQEDLTKALAGAPQKGMEATVEFILANISTRMADGLREEVENLGAVKSKEAEAAMNAVVAVIRQLEGEGKVLLVAPEDQDNEDG